MHLAQECEFSALTPPELESVLAATAINEVWGIDRQLTKQLYEAGFKTVLELARLDPAMVRARWSISKTTVPIGPLPQFLRRACH